MKKKVANVFKKKNIFRRDCGLAPTSFCVLTEVLKDKKMSSFVFVLPLNALMLLVGVDA